MNFDMTRTWNNCVALVQSNFQLLALLAGVFILIPNLIFYIAAPDVMAAASTMGTDEDQLIALLQENTGTLIGVGLFVMVAQFIGYASLVALMGNKRPTVGEAMRQALSAVPSLLGVTVLMVLAYIVVALGIALVIGIVGGLLSLLLGPAAAVLVGFISVALAFLAVIYVLARFIMVYPAVMLEGVSNPVAAIRRSLELTRLQGKRIFLFIILLMVAYMVISIVVSLVFGLLMSSMGTGPGAAFESGMVNGVLGSLVAMIYAGIMVAMYRQLAGSDTPDIGETFD